MLMENVFMAILDNDFGEGDTIGNIKLNILQIMSISFFNFQLWYLVFLGLKRHYKRNHVSDSFDDG